MRFNSCRGGDNCTKDGTHCQGCGRSHEEIARTKELAQAIAKFAVEMDYENVEEFANFLRDKSIGTVMKMKMEKQGVGMGIGLPIGK
ncbi:MAG: hypothetical protein MI754_18130 [Chromatiales bacterium]|nr:hypothetical protein [Chromatiales bacterium]